MVDGFLCGWRVRSDIHLPELAIWSEDNRSPDIVIRLGHVPNRLANLVEDGPFLQVDRQGTCLLNVERVAAYLVKGSGDEVIISPQPEALEAEIRLFLLGSVLGFICHQRGLFPLHASCVVIHDKAVALCGPKGVGKSTAAVQFVSRGYRLVADDICAIDTQTAAGPRVLPTFPRLKLSQDILTALKIPYHTLEQDRFSEHSKYHYIPTDVFAAAPVQLSGIFLLRRADGVPDDCIRILRPVEKIAALNGEVFRPQVASAMGRAPSLLTAQAAIAGSTPIWRLTRRFHPPNMDRCLSQIEQLII